MLERASPSLVDTRPRALDRRSPLSSAARNSGPAHMLGLLRRQWRLIVATSLLCSVLVTIAILQITPVYRAHALILVAPTGGDLLDAKTGMAASQIDSARVDGEVEVLRSPVVAKAVLARLDRLRDPIFEAWPGSGPSLGVAAATAGDVETRALDRLRRSVAIARKGLTAIIQVSAKSPDPGRAAMLANAFAEEHVRQQLDAKIAVVEESRAALERGAEAAAEASRRAESELGAFVRASIDGVGDPSTRERLRNLLADVDDAAAERARLEDVARAEADDPRSHRELLAQLKTMRNREEVLGAQLVAAFQTSGDLSPSALQRVLELRQAAIGNRELHLRALAASSAYVVRREAQMPDSRILSRAVPPSEPSFPRLPLFFALGGLASVAAGIGAAFLRESRLGGLVDAPEAERVLGIPVLAALPKAEGGESRSALVANAVKRHSAYAEAVRRARFDLEVMMSGGRTGHVILVTSAVEGEGKTVTAVALARAFAQVGRKTLLVDCDLRRPAVHNAVGIPPQHGLFDFLASSGREDNVGLTVPDRFDNLHFLFGAPGRHASTDMLLASGKLEWLLDSAREAFDTVVLDSPPLLPATDSRILAQHVDIVLMVVGPGKTTGRKAASAIAALERAGRGEASVVAVLNGVDMGDFGYARADRTKRARRSPP